MTIGGPMDPVIRVRVRAFAGLRESLGFAERGFAVAPGTDVARLIEHLADVHSDAGLSGRGCAVAVNRAYAAPDRVLEDGDEVALIPPVSGGAAKCFEITDRPISLDEVARRVASAEVGGIALFAGIVRGCTAARRTDFLVCEAYGEMAEASFAAIAREVQARWPAISGVAIVHRVGRLEVGDLAVAIAVAASHRREPFEACRYVIDRIKQDSPIWKREVGPEGSAWIEGLEPVV